MVEPAPKRPHLRPASEFLELTLEVRDPEALAELQAIEDGDARLRHAELALKVGLLSIKHARGEIDVRAIRGEGDRLLTEFEKVLENQRRSVQDRLEHTLGAYFDPESGRFSERVKGLVEKDGALARQLESAVGREDSTLARTLSDHFGPESRLMRLLSPRDSEGLLASLESRLAEALQGQRERILEQFSLDREGSALSRLVKELGDRHGDLTQQLEAKVQDVVREFSLDEEGSALSRLVGRVEGAQRQLQQEFSLDQDGSALARMRKEMLGVFRDAEKANEEFRARVLEELSAMRTRREERSRSTGHGFDFEDAVGEWLTPLVTAAGDLHEHTGTKTGSISRSQVGDHVITLGPESAAAGARIVIEAKDKQNYTLAMAQDEIVVARRNRDAQVGLFIFAAASAPSEGPRFLRRGMDVFVVWDHEDPASDVWLEAGLTVARALCVAEHGGTEARQVDLPAALKAVNEVEKQAHALDKIKTSTETIQRSAETILNEVRVRRKHLLREVRNLRSFTDDVKDALAD